MGGKRKGAGRRGGHCRRLPAFMSGPHAASLGLLGVACRVLTTSPALARVPWGRHLLTPGALGGFLAGPAVAGAEGSPQDAELGEGSATVLGIWHP